MCYTGSVEATYLFQRKHRAHLSHAHIYPTLPSSLFGTRHRDAGILKALPFEAQ